MKDECLFWIFSINITCPPRTLPSTVNTMICHYASLGLINGAQYHWNVTVELPKQVTQRN